MLHILTRKWKPLDLIKDDDGVALLKPLAKGELKKAQEDADICPIAAEQVEHLVAGVREVNVDVVSVFVFRELQDKRGLSDATCPFEKGSGSAPRLAFPGKELLVALAPKQHVLTPRDRASTR